MRKFYSLSAILLVLLSSQTKARTVYDTCGANFEKLASATANVLSAGFVALPSDSSDKKPEQICWDFGDGRDTCVQYDPAINSNYFVSHTYYHTGAYEVCVKILYQGGCQADKCKSIQIGDADSCSIKFETVNSTSNTLGKYFTAQPWDALGKKPVLICWDFGDSQDSCIQYSTSYTGSYAIFHAYPHSGSYNVCVKVQFDGGCESHYCSPVEVGDASDSCSADFETGFISSIPLGRHFRAIPWNNQNKKPVYICWNFGDQHDTCVQYSNTYTGSYDVYHIYRERGLYEVCVRIVYDGGCEAKKCKVIQIGEPDSCSASFEVISVTSDPLRKYFVAKPWNNHDKKPLLICWNFGDNHDTCIQFSTTYTGTYAISHSYLRSGMYNVCVRIHYDGGCQSYYCHAVQVGEADSCKADFERIPVTAGSDPRLVKYRAIPGNDHDKKPAKICWVFGDGKDTCISYPENYTGEYTVGHHYDHSGIYEVCVRIIYFGGCEAKRCKILHLFFYNSECRVRLYQIVSSVASLSRVFYFASGNDARPARVCWSFGDGTDTCVSIDPNTTDIPRHIKHEYPGPGTYHACAKVLFTNGCTASDCVEVSIRSLTDLCGGYYTDSLINPATYLFKGFSIHKADDAVTGYRWMFGDGSSATGQTATHTYGAAGVYRVCLIITTQNGCETKICNDVRIAGDNQARLLLTPNPVISILHALFYSTHNEGVKIKIINANGAVVKEYSRDAVTGANMWDFDVSGLVPGMYTFVVQSPNQFASGIFFKF